MITTVSFILIGSWLIAFLLLSRLWLYAERTYSVGARMCCALPVMIWVVISVSFLAVVITKLDDQSYYAASIRILIDESLESLGEADGTFEDRLKQFSDQQPISYESRANLLENLRKFYANGKALRAVDSMEHPTGQSRE